MLEDLETDVAAELMELTEYGPETAGGVMTTDFITIDEKNTAAEAIEKVREDTDAEAHEIFVVDDAGLLTGFVTLRRLLESEDAAQSRDVDFGKLSLDRVVGFFDESC